MSEQKGTDAITGITNFLFLAFILPGVIYVCFVILLFGVEEIKKAVPGISVGWDVGIAAVVFLGLTLTSIAFVIEIVWLKFCSLIKSTKVWMKYFHQKATLKLQRKCLSKITLRPSLRLIEIRNWVGIFGSYGGNQ